MRSKTYGVNKASETLFISYISPLAKYNPPPQFANWGTSFLKEALALRGTGEYLSQPHIQLLKDQPKHRGYMRT